MCTVGISLRVGFSRGACGKVEFFVEASTVSTRCCHESLRCTSTGNDRTFFNHGHDGFTASACKVEWPPPCVTISSCLAGIRAIPRFCLTTSDGLPLLAGRTPVLNDCLFFFIDRDRFACRYATARKALAPATTAACRSASSSRGSRTAWWSTSVVHQTQASVSPKYHSAQTPVLTTNTPLDQRGEQLLGSW